jgi:hypothetical protein
VYERHLPVLIIDMSARFFKAMLEGGFAVAYR